MHPRYGFTLKRKPRSGLSFSATIDFARSSKTSSAAAGGSSRYSTAVLAHGFGGFAIGSGRTERMYRNARELQAGCKGARLCPLAPRLEQRLELGGRRDRRRARAVLADVRGDQSARGRGLAFEHELRRLARIGARGID